MFSHPEDVIKRVKIQLIRVPGQVVLLKGFDKNYKFTFFASPLAMWGQYDADKTCSY